MTNIFLVKDKTSNRWSLYTLSGVKTKKQKVSKLIQDYSEYATIQGLCYIFSSHQTLFGRWFWILAVCFMLGLGTYWSCIMYIGWNNQQVFILRNLKLECFTKQICLINPVPKPNFTLKNKMV